MQYVVCGRSVADLEARGSPICTSSKVPVRPSEPRTPSCTCPRPGPLALALPAPPALRPCIHHPCTRSVCDYLICIHVYAHRLSPPTSLPPSLTPTSSLRSRASQRSSLPPLPSCINVHTLKVKRSTSPSLPNDLNVSMHQCIDRSMLGA